MATLVAPRLEVVADRRAVHAVRFGRDGQLDELTRRELLRRRLVSEFQVHASFLLHPLDSADGTGSDAPSPTACISRTPTWSTGHLVADDTGVMLIDAGFPGSRDDVLASLRQLGFGVDDLRAILLTHAHIDHFGSAIWFAKTHGTPVYCHADEVGHAKREYLEQASPVDVAAHALAAALAEVVGGDQPQGCVHARRHPDRAGADRGRRRRTARCADGHPEPGTHRRALLVRRRRRAGQRRRAGDGASRSPPATGPQLLHKVFNHDQEGCVRSLAALAMLETDVLVPGHGPVWRGPIREAAAQATPR